MCDEGAVTKLYRIERFLYTHHFRTLAKLLYYFIQLAFNCVIPPSVKIGRGLCIAHGVGIVIHHEAVVGDRVKICQNVTLGGPGVVIGNDCLLGAGAVVIGPCVVGAGTKVGANTVVNFNTPENSTVVGCKGRILT